MSSLLLAVVLAAVGVIHKESVDELEREFVFGSTGRLLFVRMVFTSEGRSTSQVVNESQALCIHRDHGGKGWFMLWIDDGVVREVSAKSFMETWTQFDRELVERERLPVERRRGLRK